MKPRYESIHCSGKFRSTAPYRLSKGAKLLAQRYVQVTHTPESVVQALSLDIRVHGNVSPQAFAVPSLEPSGMILQKSDMLWTLLSIDIVVPLSLEGVDRARVSSADRCGRHVSFSTPTPPNEWFTGFSFGKQSGCDQHVRAVNNGQPDCENIDWLSSR
jgi:hypothetical protein